MLQEILKGRPPTTPQITEALNRAATFLEHRPRPVTSTQQQVTFLSVSLFYSKEFVIVYRNVDDV